MIVALKICQLFDPTPEKAGTMLHSFKGKTLSSHLEHMHLDSRSTIVGSSLLTAFDGLVRSGLPL
jgi:hypothetical protein